MEYIHVHNIYNLHTIVGFKKRNKYVYLKGPWHEIFNV
jgi:hypothetical protein